MTRHEIVQGLISPSAREHTHFGQSTSWRANVRICDADSMVVAVDFLTFCACVKTNESNVAESNLITSALDDQQRLLFAHDGVAEENARCVRARTAG